jgi:hypothetical protein
MITGFEDLTKDLTDKDRHIVLTTIRVLRVCNGKASAIKNREIAREVATVTGYVLTSIRIRKVVNYIRVKNLLPGLLASSLGYYIASNEQEYLDYIESLDDRIRSVIAVRDALEKQFTERYNKYVVRTLGNNEEPELVAVEKNVLPAPGGLDPDYFDYKP